MHATSPTQPFMRPLRVGARGWEYDAWSPYLYPEDLPHEWRLAYYANEFDTVIVPPLYGQRATCDDARDWRDSVPAAFRFYIELTAPSSGEQLRLEQLRALAAELDARRTTLLFPISTETSLDLGASLEHVHVLASRQPVCLLLDGPAAQVGLGDILSGSNVTLGCKLAQNTGRFEDFVVGSTQPSLVLVEGVQNKTADLRWLRSVVESLLRTTGDDTDVSLMFAGDPPRVEDMRNARTIADLL